MKILIADDEERIRLIVRKYAEFEGMEVLEARDGVEAVQIAEKELPDVAVLDIMMPRMDGFQACRLIRRQTDIPVIMLSARGEEYDKLQAFEDGVDDYVVKPFSAKELMMRIAVIHNRHRKAAVPAPAAGDPAQGHEVYRLGSLLVDFTGRRVFIGGEEKNLTNKEFELLTYMITNRNIALSRDRLIEVVWGFDYYGDDRTLDTHVKMLRNNLGEYRDHIVTLRGVGYRFEE